MLFQLMLNYLIPFVKANLTNGLVSLTYSS